MDLVHMRWNSSGVKVDDVAQGQLCGSGRLSGHGRAVF